jgi:hypothetical protein
MVPTGLHFGGWNSPAFGIPIDPAPLHFIDHAGAGGERERAIFAVVLGADGVGFLTVVAALPGLLFCPA